MVLFECLVYTHSFRVGHTWPTSADIPTPQPQKDTPYTSHGGAGNPTAKSGTVSQEKPVVSFTFCKFINPCAPQFPYLIVAPSQRGVPAKKVKICQTLSTHTHHQALALSR